MVFFRVNARLYSDLFFLCDTNYFVVCIAIILIILKTLALYNDLHVDTIYYTSGGVLVRVRETGGYSFTIQESIT